MTFSHFFKTKKFIQCPLLAYFMPSNVGWHFSFHRRFEIIIIKAQQFDIYIPRPPRHAAPPRCAYISFPLYTRKQFDSRHNFFSVNRKFTSSKNLLSPLRLFIARTFWFRSLLLVTRTFWLGYVTSKPISAAFLCVHFAKYSRRPHMLSLLNLLWQFPLKSFFVSLKKEYRARWSLYIAARLCSHVCVQVSNFFFVGTFAVVAAFLMRCLLYVTSCLLIIERERAVSCKLRRNAQNEEAKKWT